MNPMSARLVMGDTVFTVMSPDTTFDKTGPDHLEGFEMTPCIVQGTHFWGAADTILIGPDGRPEAAGRPVNFYYSDMKNYFMTGSYTRSGAEVAGKVLQFGLASIHRYKFHEFRAVPDYRLVWDSAVTPEDKEPLRKALEGGRRLKLAIQLEDDLWITHRVVHARQEDGGRYRFVTPALPVPNVLSAAKSMFDEFPEITPDRGLTVQSGVLQAGLSPSTDGTCVWYGPDLAPTSRTYITLRIFENV